MGWDLRANASKTDAGALQKYLDGSCIVFIESQLAQIVDFKSAHEQQMIHDGENTVQNLRRCKSINRAVMHSGNVTTPTGGKQCMQVDLSALPTEVTDLFFVLSAFGADDLASFPNPRVEILDAVSGRKLTEYSIADCGHAQAVVMCSLSRPHGKWIVNGLGIPTDGNVKDYLPIRRTISERKGGYLRWERRGHLVKIRALLKQARLCENSTNDFARLLGDIMSLPTSIFQLVILCL